MFRSAGSKDIDIVHELLVAEARLGRFDQRLAQEPFSAALRKNLNHIRRKGRRSDADLVAQLLVWEADGAVAGFVVNSAIVRGAGNEILMLSVVPAFRGRGEGRKLQSELLTQLHPRVDLFARWRITDPLQYFLRLRDERSAQSRLDDILGSETRNAVAKHELIEIIRTTRDRVPLRDALLTEAERDMGSLVPIQKGRKQVEREIFAAAAEKVRVFGIELLDIRFKRINYNDSVRPKIYDRMISELRQIAERFAEQAPDLIVTAEASGIPPAMATARHLPVPVVYAKKYPGVRWS